MDPIIDEVEEISSSEEDIENDPDYNEAIEEHIPPVTRSSRINRYSGSTRPTLASLIIPHPKLRRTPRVRVPGIGRVEVQLLDHPGLVVTFTDFTYSNRLWSNVLNTLTHCGVGAREMRIWNNENIAGGEIHGEFVRVNRATAAQMEQALLRHCY